MPSSFASGIGLEMHGRLGDNAAPMHGKSLKALAIAAMALAFAFSFLLGVAKISDPDTFWHLKTGEWIVSHHAVPRVDPFSSTTNGKPWLDWEWLFQAGIYAIYSLGGFNALIVTKAAIVLLTAVVLFLACRKNGAGIALAALIAMAALAAARERLEVRPDVVMLLFVALTVALLDSARRGRAYSLFWLPALEIVWVNTLASFLLGIALTFLYFVVSMFKRDRARVHFALVLVIAVIVCLINPYGVAILRDAVTQSLASGPAGVIGEWQPTRLLLLTEPNWSLRVFWWLFWLNPIVLIAVVAIKRRATPWEHVLVVVGLSVLALRAYRFTALYAVGTAPILACGLATLRERIAGKNRSDWSEAVVAVVAGVVAISLIFAMVTNRWAVVEDRAPTFGLGVDETSVPLRALAMMAKLPAGLGVFNSYDLGGPLMWKGSPQWQPFCHGHANLYGREFVNRYRKAMLDPDEWDKWMEERSVTVAFIHNGGGDERTLLQHLVKTKDRNWDMLYFDHVACIFVHRSAWPELRDDKQLADFKPVRVTDTKAVLAYAHRLADEAAGADAYGRARIVTAVGSFLVTIHATDAAEALFEDAIKLHPRPSLAWMNLAVIKSDQGDRQAAMELTDRLLEINPHFFYARLLQAQIKATDKDLDGAESEVDEVLSEQPHSAQAWLLLAQLAARHGDRRTAIRAIQRTIAERVEDPQLYHFLGQLLAAEGQTNDAVAAYGKCLELWSGPEPQRQEVVNELKKLSSS